MFRELANCHKSENYRKIYLKIVCEFGPRMAAGRHLGKLQRHRAVSLRQHGFLVTVCVIDLS